MRSVLFLLTFLTILSSCSKSPYREKLARADKLIYHDSIYKAQDLFLEIKREYPDQPGGYYGFGYCMMKMQLFERALANMDSAFAINPNHQRVAYNRVICLLRNNKIMEALADVNPLIAHDPEDPQLYAVRGEIYTGIWKYVEAASDLDKAIELDPQNCRWYFIRGEIAGKQLQADLANSYFDKTVELGCTSKPKTVFEYPYFR